MAHKKKQRVESPYKGLGSIHVEGKDVFFGGAKLILRKGFCMRFPMAAKDITLYDYRFLIILKCIVYGLFKLWIHPVFLWLFCKPVSFKIFWKGPIRNLGTPVEVEIRPTWRVFRASKYNLWIVKSDNGKLAVQKTYFSILRHIRDKSFMAVDHIAA